MDQSIKKTSVDLTRFFTSGFKVSVKWTYHSAERFLERFQNKITQNMVTALSQAILVLRDSAESQISYTYNHVRVVVARNNNTYSVITVINRVGQTNGYDFQ